MPDDTRLQPWFMLSSAAGNLLQLGGLLGGLALVAQTSRVQPRWRWRLLLAG